MKSAMDGIRVKFIQNKIFFVQFYFPNCPFADTYDNHLFHIMIQNNLIYLAMTTNGFERRIAFAFLEKIRFAGFDSASLASWFLWLQGRVWIRI